MKLPVGVALFVSDEPDRAAQGDHLSNCLRCAAGKLARVDAAETATDERDRALVAVRQVVKPPSHAVQHFACGAVVAAGPPPVRPVSELFEDGPQGAGGGIGCVQPGENENRVFVAARKRSEQGCCVGLFGAQGDDVHCDASLRSMRNSMIVGMVVLAAPRPTSSPTCPASRRNSCLSVRTDKVDQRCGGGFRHDVITGGQHGQERHRDR